MIDLPKEITDKALLESLYPGCVIRTEISFIDGGQAFKRLIVMTNKNEKTALSITTTSQIPINKHYYRQNDIFIKKNQEKVFEKDSLLQLHRIIELETYKMQNVYNSHNLDILGCISNELLSSIYNELSNNKLIEQKYIQRIMRECSQ